MRSKASKLIRELSAAFAQYKWVVFAILAIFVLTAALELSFGRSLLGPDGKFGWWAGDTWSPENSQRVADAYSTSHVLHGILFYAGLWLVCRKLPLRYRFVIAIAIEAAWEVLENSPLIIERYRQATIAVGYIGDSVLNSLSDIWMTILGFALAWRAKVWVSVLVIVLVELFMLWWVRDNLTLNVIMLLYPIESIRLWQAAGHML